MNRFGRLAASVAVTMSMIASSTGAVAASAPAPVPVDSWAALSVMSGGAPAAAVCGLAATAAAQPAAGCVLPQAGTPPVPIAETVPLAPPAVIAGPGLPSLPALLILAAALSTFLAISFTDRDNIPNSPA